MHMNGKTSTGVSSEKEQVNESPGIQYSIVSCPGLGSDPPTGSDRGSGCDISSVVCTFDYELIGSNSLWIRTIMASELQF